MGLEYKEPTERIDARSVVLSEKSKVFNNSPKSLTKKKTPIKKNSKTKKKSKLLTNTPDNDKLYKKYSHMSGQQLRDELSELLNLPKGLNTLVKLNTKSELINRILEIRREKEKDRINTIKIKELKSF